MSTPIVRDTVQPQNMLLDVSYAGVLAYRDGLYRWPDAQVQRFIKAGKLIYPITVIGNNPHLAQVADCESGDLSPQGAATWARERNQLHHDATIYCNKSTVPAVVKALGTEPAWLWLADPTGAPHTPNVELPAHIKLAAVQFAWENLYDLSAILSPAWPASPWKGTDW